MVPLPQSWFQNGTGFRDGGLSAGVAVFTRKCGGEVAMPLAGSSQPRHEPGWGLGRPSTCPALVQFNGNVPRPCPFRVRCDTDRSASPSRHPSVGGEVAIGGGGLRK